MLLVGTASARRFKRVLTVNVLNKNIKIIFISNKIFNFTADKNICLLHGQVNVM